MKRFTVFTALFSVSILAVWMTLQLFTAARPTNNPIRLQPSHNEIMKTVDSASKAVVPVTGVEARAVAPAPIYDANGRIVSLNPNGSGNNNAILAPSANRKVAPVYDASGALISDPTGTLNSSEETMKVSPVYNARGELVSDPTGTVWSANNP